MIEEIETRAKQFYSILKYAYNSYNNVAIVSPDLVEPTSKISGRKNNIKLIHNINNFNEIKDNASKDINTYYYYFSPWPKSSKAKTVTPLHKTTPPA